MSNPGLTVYFRGFPEDVDNESLESVFAEYGKIIKCFVHKSRSYGMVEFEELSSCSSAIADLNGKPPLNLFLNMAKNGPTERNGNEPKRTSPQKPSTNSALNDFVTYEEKPIFVDDNDGVINVLMDPLTDEIYVPIRYAPNIRRLVQKIPVTVKNGYHENNDIDNDDNRSVTHATRKVNYDNNSHDIKIQRSFTENDNSPNQSFQKSQRPSFGNRNFSDNRSNDYPNKMGDQRQYNRSFKTGYQSPNSGDENKPRFNKKYQGGGGDNNQSRFPRRESFSKFPEKDERDWSNQASNSASSSFNKPAFEPRPSNKREGNWNASSAAAEDKIKKPEENTLKRSTSNSSISKTSSIVKKLLIKKTNKVSYKTVELPKNQYTEVNVEDVINETLGWVSISDKANDLATFMVQIIERELVHPKVTEPEVGKICLAHYDDCWFRAVVLATTPQVKVRFIDYGNESDVTGGLLELSPDFQEVPAFAVNIKLANGAPCEMELNKTLKVKPVNIENDVVEVHVENGIYGQEEPKPSTSTGVASFIKSSDDSIKSSADSIKPSASSVKPPASSVKPSTSSVKSSASSIKSSATSVTSSAPAQTPNKFNSLTACQEALMNGLQPDMLGLISMTMKLSDTQGVAFLMPTDLTDELETLEAISKDIESNNPSFEPKVGDLVAAENEGWNRAFILSIKDGFKVAFIDFGIIKTVPVVRALPDASFMKIPQFSCVFTTAALDKIELNNEKLFKVIKVLNGTVHCQFDDDTGDFTFFPWSPKVASSNAVSSSASLETVKTVEKKLAPSNLKLKNGDDVKIVDESNGYVYLRTKEGSDILKRVDKYIAEYAPKAPKITKEPFVGQFIAAQYDNVWYRAVVKSVNQDNAEILYIDYGNEEIKPFFSLKQLDEKCCQEPCSLIKTKLRGFVDKNFSKKNLAYLANLSATNQILKATFQQFENGVDLITKDGKNISDELVTMDTVAPFQGRKEWYMKIKPPGKGDRKVMNIKLQPIPLGIGEVKFLNDIDIENQTVCVCINNPETLHQVHVYLLNQMTKYATHIAPQEPYMPLDEEVVLVQNGDKWYRALCLSRDNDEFTVFVIDYGINLIVKADVMRQLPYDFVEGYNALGNFAIIEGLPDNPTRQLTDRMKSLFTKNEIYKVEVLAKDTEDNYSVLFLDVLKQLKDENLM